MQVPYNVFKIILRWDGEFVVGLCKQNWRALAVITILILLVNFLSGTGLSADKNTEKLAGSVTIYRDKYGVPHVFGKTDASVVFGLMYAQAEDNFWQLEEDHINKFGRASEIYGPSRLVGDLMIRLFETNQNK